MSVQHDYESIVVPHLTPGVTLPSPLLPTNNEKIIAEVYTRGAARARMEDFKPADQKKKEFDTLKRSAENFMLASKCLHMNDCKAYYYKDIAVEKWKRGLSKAVFKRMVYDPLVVEVKKQTEKEAWVNLGKQLKALGYPGEDDY